jgi:glycosyltransferase involved in cell wall biosynthesis
MKLTSEKRIINNAIKLWSLIVMIVFLPQRLLRKLSPVTTDGVAMITKKRSLIGSHRLSVIMPAYNEINTIQECIEKVLIKQLRGMDIELIIVESNSTDGTKDIVNLHKDHPRVKVVFEQKPSGKGHAVRAGFKVATGDFILIQDADDEYDVQDYEILLEPLISGREVFVLGARYGVTSWNVRKFGDQPMRAILLNLGHWIFATLINILYGVRLKDPFTMYKVFKRDCIQDIVFECNRFDFDHELVLKLIRKGYKPIEIPVRYHSRSFAHGKKVRIFTDPLTWLRAIIKFRFVKV